MQYSTSDIASDASGGGLAYGAFRLVGRQPDGAAHLQQLGALLRGAVFHLEGTRLPVEVIGKRIGQAVREVLEVAGEVGDAPVRVAMREAERRVRARWEE